MSRNISSLPKAESRISKVDGNSLGILTYDLDNGYPQRMLSLINACSTAKQACALLRDYTIGQGFVNYEFSKAVINEDRNNELTPDLLLQLLADDKSKHRGLALQINYNALYQISSINYVDFETIRIGIKDNEGKYLFNPDWYSGRLDHKKIVIFHAFSMNPEVIEEQVNEDGGWDEYNGQILYFSEDYNTYPLSSIDEVVESVETEIESDKTTKNNLKNNFQLKAIWVEKGKFENDRERDEYTAEIQEFVGSEGRPIAVVESLDPDGKDIPQIIPFTNALNDKLFAYSDEKSRSKIYRAFRQPAILHSDYMGTNGYNRDQLRDSMEYYTNYTHPNRIFFEELFTKLFSNFHENINDTGDYSIEPLKNLALTEPKVVSDGTTNI